MNHRLLTLTARAVSWLGLSLLVTALALPVGAAEPVKPAPTAKRPKICLVLSGGGARGAAHIGVLKVLEEYRVPVDCIAGTSMGALVGAAYASGATAAELKKYTDELSSEKLFKDNPPRAEISMRQKSDDYKNFFGPEIGFADGELKLPKGVVTGVQLETVLRQLSKLKGYQDFDKLPIPFRAVATDLVTGKAVVFDEGELANVMRASMAIPGAVAPAEFDGKMLVDGMLTSNLPVDAARAMGADIIIAVNVGTPLLKRDQLNGIGGVLGQMLSILTEQNVQASIASLKPTDILISPDLGAFSTSDFDHMAKIVPPGEAAARDMAKRLASLAIPVDEYAALRKRQLVAVAPDVRPVDEIRFEKMRRVNPAYAKNVMQTETGQPFDQSKLDEDMRRLYGTGDFEHVNYRFLDGEGPRVLEVQAAEKSWGPDYLRFGLGLSSDFKGDAYYNLLASYRRTWLNSLGAEWRTDLQIGRTNSLGTEFYQPLDAEGLFFVRPYASLERRTADVYQGNSRIATFDTKAAIAGVDAGIQLQQYGTIRLGVLGGKLKNILDSGPQSLKSTSGNTAQGGVRFGALIDQIDSVHFPREGWRAGVDVYDSTSRLGADDSYTKWYSSAVGVYSFGSHTFNVSAAAGGKLGSNPLPNYDQFQWGGFMRLGGYATGQLIGQKFHSARVMYYHRILKGTMLEGAYGGIALEAGKVGNPLVSGNPDGLLKSATVFVAADTPIGPAYLGYGHAEGGPESFYFYLGRPF